MKASFEWQISRPEPDGTVSVVIRFTTEECRVRDQNFADAVGLEVIQALEDAIAKEFLNIPTL